MLQGLNKSSARKAVVAGIQGIETKLQEDWMMKYPEEEGKNKPHLLASQFSFERLHEVSVFKRRDRMCSCSSSGPIHY